MEVVKQDILDIHTPALSSTSDMPLIETKPDSVPVPKTDEQKAKDAVLEPAVPEEKAVPAAEEKPVESASTEQPDDPSAEPEPKKAKGVQKRIDELTRQREDERRRAEAAESRLDRALAALEKSGGVRADTAKQAMESDDPEPQKPVRDQNNPDAYDAALETYVSERASWIARREVKASLAEAERARQEKEASEQIKTVQETYRARVEKAKGKYSDYSEVAESPDVQVTMVMASAIAHSEEGPELAYYLGKNPEEAQRISKLVPQLQLVELGKISAKLNAPSEKPKPISAAPKPGTPIKAGSEATVSPEEESMEAYAARRKKELAQQYRPGVRH